MQLQKQNTAIWPNIKNVPYLGISVRTSLNLLYNYFTSQHDLTIPGTILAFVLTFVGAIGGFVTFIMLLIANFKKNVGWGVGSLLGVPLLVFAIMHFNEVKKRFLFLIAFIIMMVVATTATI